ncbi:MAG: hypothetical protein HW387_595 [Parachlamydiales bacterium]|nr:hypothetical protein [Parachlamydiales bacterium]
MNTKQIFGIFLTLCGIAMIVFSFYISSQVSQGRERASSAQSTVDRGNWLFDKIPVTKEIGQGLTGSAQKKIDEGYQQIAYYEGMSRYLLLGGIGIVIIGGAIVLFSRKKIAM